MEEWTLEFIGKFDTGFTVKIQQKGFAYRKIKELKANPTLKKACSDLIAAQAEFYNTYPKLTNLKKVEIIQIAEASSDLTLKKLFERLKKELEAWVEPLWRPLLEEEREQNSIKRLVIQTNENALLELPWEDVFEEYIISYSRLELEAEEPKDLKNNSNQIRILELIDENYIKNNPSQNIQTNKEKDDIRKVLSSLKSNIKFESPDLSSKNKILENIHKSLIKDEGYLMFVYAGHSTTQDNIGIFESFDDIEIIDLQKSFKIAISRGLCLAIFNSCRGLGFARTLSSTGLMYTIVMRHDVPTAIVHEFFRSFLYHFFYEDKSIDLAVKEARQDLKWREKQLPCASWFPVIFRNTTEPVHNWKSLQERYGLKASHPLLEDCEQTLYNTIDYYCTQNKCWLKIISNNNIELSRAISKIIEKFRAEPDNEINAVLINFKTDRGFPLITSVYEFMIQSIITQVQIQEKNLNLDFYKDSLEELLKLYLKSKKLLLIFDHFDTIEYQFMDKICGFFKNLKDNSTSTLPTYQIWKKLNLAILYSPNRKNPQPIRHQFIGQGLIPISFKGASKR